MLLLLVIVFNPGLRRCSIDNYWSLPQVSMEGIGMTYWQMYDELCSGDITVSESTEFWNARIWTATATNFSATSSFAPNMVSLLNTVNSETKLFNALSWARCKNSRTLYVLCTNFISHCARIIYFGFCWGKTLSYYSCRRVFEETHAKKGERRKYAYALPITKDSQVQGFSDFLVMMYTVLHIFMQVLFGAINQGNHQNFDLSYLKYARPD